MKIFVTGATGFIGQNLVRALARENHEIYALVRDKDKADIFEGLNVKLIEGFLEDSQSYTDFFRNNRIDIIYHLAAIPGQKWGYKAKDYYQINVKATENLLHACFGKIKRFIFCSSVNAFSKDNKFLYDDYGKSKQEAEKIVQDFAKKGLETIIIRPTVVYGPNDAAGMMLKLCGLIKKSRFSMIGKGHNHFPLVYIDDLIDAFLSAKDCHKINGTYEIVGPDQLTFSEIVNEIAKILEVKLSKIKIPRFFALSCAYFSKAFYSLIDKEPFITKHRVDIVTQERIFSSQKAREELGYRPQVFFSLGIRKTIDWYKGNGYI